MRNLSEDRSEWDEDDVKYAMDREMFDSVEEANSLLEDIGSDFRYGETTSAPSERLGQFAGSAEPDATGDELDELNKDELLDVAIAEDVEYLSSDRKDEIKEKIRAARRAQV